jgi:hypothetical protein
MRHGETPFTGRDGPHGDPSRLEVVGETTPPGRIGRDLEQFGVHALVCPFAGGGGGGSRFAFLLLFRGKKIVFGRGWWWWWWWCDLSSSGRGGRGGFEERCVRCYPFQDGTRRGMMTIVFFIFFIFFFAETEARKTIKLSCGVDLQGAPLEGVVNERSRVKVSMRHTRFCSSSASKEKVRRGRERERRENGL